MQVASGPCTVMESDAKLDLTEAQQELREWEIGALELWARKQCGKASVTNQVCSLHYPSQQQDIAERQYISSEYRAIERALRVFYDGPRDNMMQLFLSRPTAPVLNLA